MERLYSPIDRRWARSKGLPEWEGHREGAKKFEKFLNWCLELGIPQVSAYVLSTENLNRSKEELNRIFDIVCELLKKWLNDGELIDKYEVKVNFVGDLKKLPKRVLSLIKKMIEKTAKYSKKVLNILIAYGGKFEITQAVKGLIKKVMQTGKLQITQKDLEDNLLIPAPVDLVIRTGGHSRLSNFLLWQTSYAELYFTETLWPDFSKRELIKAINWFNSVQRKFGR